MTSRTKTQLTIRLHPEQVAALDRIAEEEESTRARVLRESIDLRLRTDSQAQLLRDAVSRAASVAAREIAEQARRSIAEMLETARATDHAHRVVINEFLEQLAGGKPPPASRPSLSKPGGY